MECGGLNENGSHRLIGSGSIRRCGLLGGNMSLEVGFEVSEAYVRPTVSLSSCYPRFQKSQLREGRHGLAGTKPIWERNPRPHC